MLSDNEVVIDDMDPADARALVVGRVPPAGSFGLEPGERLEVVSADEVTIICMDGADTPAWSSASRLSRGRWSWRRATRSRWTTWRPHPHGRDDAVSARSRRGLAHGRRAAESRPQERAALSC